MVRGYFARAERVRPKAGHPLKMLVVELDQVLIARNLRDVAIYSRKRRKIQALELLFPQMKELTHLKYRNNSSSC